MNVITLLSDWRLRDPYVAMLKGEILSRIPDANIVDISHYVDKFNVLQESILMKNSYKAFPAGTLHLTLVNTSLNSTFEPVVLQHNGHFFIGEDNGIFFLMFGQDTILKGRKLRNSTGNSVSDLLEIAASIINNNLEENTVDYPNFKRMFVEGPEYSPQERKITGKIVYIDAFNNAITNISSKSFHEMVGNNPFSATIQSKGEWSVTDYSDGYTDFGNDMFLTDNSLDLIEVSSYQADVAVLADLEPGDIVNITY